MLSLLGLEKRPDKLFHYQKYEDVIQSLIHRMKMATIYFECVYLVCGITLPIWYFIDGNHDPETWIIMNDKFS